MRAHDELINRVECDLLFTQNNWTNVLNQLFWLAYGLGFDEGMRESDLNHQRKGN